MSVLFFRSFPVIHHAFERLHLLGRLQAFGDAENHQEDLQNDPREITEKGRAMNSTMISKNACSAVRVDSQKAVLAKKKTTTRHK